MFIRCALQLTALVLLSTSAISAQSSRGSIQGPPRATERSLCGVDRYADLTLASVEVQKSDDIVITVESRGACASRAARLSILISGAVDGVVPKPPLYTRSELLAMPPIPTGQTRVFKFTHPFIYGGISGKTLVLDLKVDASNTNKEEDEYNNEIRITSVAP